jgi:hypothetical protein
VNIDLSLLVGNARASLTHIKRISDPNDASLNHQRRPSFSMADNGMEDFGNDDNPFF